jgi:uncharacterized protein YdhG (YjbR/CyaY superfamily)
MASPIDDYLAGFTGEKRAILEQVCESIRAAAPGAQEKISYGMPTFWQGHNLVHFAGMKNHLGFYPGASGVAVFADRLTADGYKTSKGAIQFPWDKPVPYELIVEITRFRVDEETHS